MNPVSPMICKTPTLTLTLACRLSRNGRIMAHSPYRQFRAALCSSCAKKLFNFKRKRFSFRCKLGWMWWRTESSASQVVSRGPCERIRPRSMQFYSSGWAFVSGPRFELLDGPRLMRAKIAASMSTPYTHQQGWASSSASPLIFLQTKFCFPLIPFTPSISMEPTKISSRGKKKLIFERRWQQRLLRFRQVNQ